MIRHRFLAAVLLAAAPLGAGAAPPSIKAPIEAAIADPARPPEDVARDADRKPAEMLRFAGVKPGMTVVDLLPGGGYFTRLFADVVGPTGKVIAYAPDEMLKSQKAIDRLDGLATGHANVQAYHDKLMDPPPPAATDIAWTAQNYHDLHNLAGVDLVAFNKMIYANLKPGGVYVILDHAAKAGSGIADTDTLHRIDPAVVKREAIAAGFVFDGESKVLANPADDHMLKVFDPALRGHTDQFLYRFRKPRK
ncbi:class I SAM-dependent methyltransferase [Sphingomonas bacterium]|uniref:class I SAM-dependent methyltransferase n=1 Tax=Sphingomonas bacterium TaxID=1895847 RepID=UPI001C2D00F8|nr:methyltransferase [Sphingomonas bacterium]